MKCLYCTRQVENERVEVLRSKVCSHCAKSAPPVAGLDPDVVCARASAAGGNGFSPKD